jgi:hypothetical protein
LNQVAEICPLPSEDLRPVRIWSRPRPRRRDVLTTSP